MPKLSARQEAILSFIRGFLDENSYPPTVRDIQHGCDISSTSVVDYNLHILQREGHIRRFPDVSRGIELLESQGSRRRFVTIPVIGYIAAGDPVPVPTAEGWANEEPLDTLELPDSLTQGRSDLYALRVRGESMIDALIDDGDSVVIQPIQQVLTRVWRSPPCTRTLLPPETAHFLYPLRDRNLRSPHRWLSRPIHGGLSSLSYSA